MSGAWRLRAGALTLIGSLAVHQGRYLVVPRHDAHHAHAYFEWFLPLVAAVAFVALAEFAGRLANAVREPSGELPAARRIWLASSVSLLAIFGVQEALEGYLTHGAWPAPAHLILEGGWAALPLAAVVGGAIALLLRGAARAVEWARGRLAERPLRAVGASRPELPFVTPRGALLALRLSGRAPPLAR